MRVRYITQVVFAAALAAASGLITTPAHADLGDQLAKLLAKDGSPGDRFGEALAISNSTAIVGAWADDDNGSQSGSAYLFDISDPVNPLKLFKLLPDDGEEGDQFGQYVAINEDIAIVGNQLDDDNGIGSGSAYLFNTSTGKQLFKFLPDDGAADDRFGSGIAISGTTAIFGARNDDDNGSNSGSVYLFDISDPMNPKQLFKFRSDDGAAGDQFGFSVAIHGAIAIIGAFRDEDNGDNSGSAYLFDTTTGEQLFKLLPDDGAAGDMFGISCAISGPPGKEVAIVGANRDDDNGSQSGSAYLFDTTTGLQIAKLLPDDGASNDEFGKSVAISVATAIIGTPGDDDNGFNSGSAYLFDISEPAKPSQISKLLPDDGAADDVFGNNVAISGTTAIVGALNDDDNGINSGSAYLFSAIRDIDFDPPEEFTAVGEPNKHAVADFTDDLTTDVIVAVPGDDPRLTGAVQLFLNQGIDEFDEWLGLTVNKSIPVGREPSGVAVGLFNKDAFVDFAVSNAGDNNVLVFINQGTGDGTFNAPVPIAVGQRPSDVIAGEFSGDAFIDLAVANADDNNVWILVNDGSGGFAKGAMLPTNGLHPIIMDPEDLDDDKDDDIVGVNGLVAPGFKGNTPGSVFVLINNGDGTFQSAVTHEIGIGPADISVGDLNHDNFAEIVVVNNTDATVSVLVNQGDGTFITGKALPVGDAPTSIEAADLDADGDLDLAIVAVDIDIGPSVQVIQNVGVDPGELFFDDPLAFGVDADPNFVVSADFNEDFVQDLVTVNADDGASGGSVTVLINVQCPWDLDESGSVSTTDLLMLFAQWGTNPGGPPDFNNDGIIDTEDLLILFANWGLCP